MPLLSRFPLVFAVGWLTGMLRKRRKGFLAPAAPEASPDLPTRHPLDGPTRQPAKEVSTIQLHALDDPRLRAVPVAIPPRLTDQEIRDLDDRYLYISTDCAEVYVGDVYLSDIFLPLAVSLVKGYGESLRSIAAICWQIWAANVAPATNSAVDCLRTIPDFAYSELTPEGLFSGVVSDEDGYSQAWESFRAARPQVSDLWVLVVDALLEQDPINQVVNAAEEE